MAKNRDTPVVLSQIYTRAGDGGSTHLGDMSRTAKTDLRLAAYADAEEANAAIGAAIALGSLAEPLVTLLTRVQNELFDVGADLARPVMAEADGSALRVTEEYVERLEAACDEHNTDLPPLRSFILPGGTPGAALLHVARTVARRAERSVWALLEDQPDTTNREPVLYLNRLSDLLFILSRVANDGNDVKWVRSAGAGA